MANNLKKIPGFDEIVFEIRNKEYGAYQLRKKYNRNVLLALLIGAFLISTAVITPFLSAKAGGPGLGFIERPGEIKLDIIDIPVEPVIPPPPPPAPKDAEQQIRYLPPVIVDSVKAGEEVSPLTAEEAERVIRDLDAIEIITADTMEIPQPESEREPLINVQEMPMFPGGNTALLQYIAEHVVYPEVAMQNNIQGKVFVKFCVTPTGSIDRVSILKGVDPELDSEAIRVVKTFPAFSPGKQGGIPVPVWYTALINFQLKY
jgi:periplasmic protein TonB